MAKLTGTSNRESGSTMPMRRREKMVVEHENGRLEDLGLVDVCVLDGSADRRQFQWQCRAAGREGAARLNADDFDENGLRRPLEVKMRTGERQYWYVGSHAQARLAAFRYNQRLRTRQAAER